MGTFRQIFLFHSGDAPSIDELEATRLNQQRILQVIDARWIVLSVFALYGCYLAVYAARDQSLSLTPIQLWAPVAIMVLVAGTNLLFRLTYKRWARLRVANLGQLLLDLLIVTTLIHLSGGVHSWFWAMYLLIVLEAAFLLERSGEVWTVVGLVWLLYGGVLAFEAAGLLQPMPMPYVAVPLHANLSFVMISFGWVLCMSAVVGGVAIVLSGMIRDREMRLRHLVVRDELTGLYNRRHFFQRLRGEVSRCARYKRTFSLIILDVDDFKKVNDRFGHQVGDEVLRALGKILGENLRRSDTEPSYDVDIACRYGGEEFAIILPETEGEGGRIAAERIREQLVGKGALIVAERIRARIAGADPGGLHVTVSMGVCTFPLHASSADTMVAAADAALYEAKEAGKDRVVIATQVDPQTMGSEPSGR